MAEKKGRLDFVGRGPAIDTNTRCAQLKTPLCLHLAAHISRIQTRTALLPTKSITLSNASLELCSLFPFLYNTWKPF